MIVECAENARAAALRAYVDIYAASEHYVAPSATTTLDRRNGAAAVVTALFGIGGDDLDCLIGELAPPPRSLAERGAWVESATDLLLAHLPEGLTDSELVSWINGYLAARPTASADEIKRALHAHLGVAATRSA